MRHIEYTAAVSVSVRADSGHRVGNYPVAELFCDISKSKATLSMLAPWRITIHEMMFFSRSTVIFRVLSCFAFVRRGASRLPHEVETPRCYDGLPEKRIVF